ncbi:hypothetical protein AXG93_3719s1180 [Marchantia polymorpha subsp. ruderalis]|uniref:Uncharacterized protein n=1 Tax=Marchantia polymorpha subsp. ruderalis TaxID=1480154 RepID=A0A176VM60_MARPO|nr:hypothetical protein AXG93_3719s1180 [Marchantia polymorpha subsp. ruderalis]
MAQAAASCRSGRRNLATAGGYRIEVDVSSDDEAKSATPGCAMADIPDTSRQTASAKSVLDTGNGALNVRCCLNSLLLTRAQDKDELSGAPTTVVAGNDRS